MIVVKEQLVIRVSPPALVERAGRQVIVSAVACDWPVVLSWDGPSYVSWVLPVRHDVAPCP